VLETNSNYCEDSEIYSIPMKTATLYNSNFVKQNAANTNTNSFKHNKIHGEIKLIHFYQNILNDCSWYLHQSVMEVGFNSPTIAGKLNRVRDLHLLQDLIRLSQFC